MLVVLHLASLKGGIVTFVAFVWLFSLCAIKCTFKSAYRVYRLTKSSTLLSAPVLASRLFNFLSCLRKYY